MRNTAEYQEMFSRMEKIYLTKGIEEVTRTFESAMKMFNRSLKKCISIKEVCERTDTIFSYGGKYRQYSYDYRMALSGIEKHSKQIEMANMIMGDLKAKYNF
jgi:IS1 family transposase